MKLRSFVKTVLHLKTGIQPYITVKELSLFDLKVQTLYVDAYKPCLNAM